MGSGPLTPPPQANEVSPKQTYRLMTAMALAMIVLLSVAIYSLSRLSSAPWTSDLSTPDIRATTSRELPRFSLRLDDRVMGPADFRGKWTLISFWSVDCPPCLEDLPLLNQMIANWQGPEFLAVTVNVDPAEARDSVQRFLEDQQITVPSVMDTDGSLKSAFQVTEYPRHFLIGPDAKIAWEARGAFRWTESAARDQLLRLMELRVPELDRGPEE